MNPLRYLRDKLFGRPATDMQTANPVATYGGIRHPSDPLADQIRADPTAFPYVGPLDLDNYGAETDEMRGMYLRYHRTEPAARSAIEGLVASIADMDVAVLPEDEDLPEDKRVAEFVDWTVEHTPHGWDGLIRKVVLPALLMGYSVTEEVLAPTDHRRWGGYWGLRHCKSKDTNNLRLQLDAVNRDVVGVVNTVRGMASYAPDKVIVFTHADLFDNPHGVGELRAAYRACQLIDNAYKLWHYALNVYGGPFMKAKTKDKTLRPQLAKALSEARQGGYIVIADGDEVEVLNMAASVNFEAFERKVDKLREEIWLTVRGAYLPFMQSTGGGGETRGSADTAKTSGSDPKERLIAKAVGRCLTRQLAARLARVNFGPRAGVPRVTLGGVDWAETAAQLDIAKRLKDDFGLPVSKKKVYRFSQWEPPSDPADATAVGPSPPPGGLGGLGGLLSPAPQPQSQRFAADEYPDAFAAGSPPFPGAVLTEVRPGVHRWTKPDDSTSGGGDGGPTPEAGVAGGSSRPVAFDEKAASAHVAAMPGLSSGERTGLLGAMRAICSAGASAVRVSRAVASAVYDEAKLWGTRLALAGLTYADALPDAKELTNPLTGSTSATGGADVVSGATGVPAASFLATKVVPHVASYALLKAKSLLGGKATHADLFAELVGRDEVLRAFRSAILAVVRRAVAGGEGTDEQSETFRR